MAITVQSIVERMIREHPDVTPTKVDDIVAAGWRGALDRLREMEAQGIAVNLTPVVETYPDVKRSEG